MKKTFLFPNQLFSDCFLIKFYSEFFDEFLAVMDNILLINLVNLPLSVLF